MEALNNFDIRHKRIFNLIAPVYGLLNGYVKNHFRDAIHTVQSVVDIEGKNILDIGTGTGAWAALFKEKGASGVHGLDFAEKMVQIANSKYGNDIKFSIANAQNLKEYSDGSYDIVTASFVLHGVNKKKREKILLEMKRISNDQVIIHDYYGRTGPLIHFLEQLEKSDYINFKSNFYSELSNYFPHVLRKKVSNGRAIYFASKSRELEN